METAARTVKVGPITLALGLIALGGGLLAANLGYTGVTAVLKLWPLLLISLGVEYFVRRFGSGEKEIRFSIPSAVLIGLLAVSASAASTISGIVPRDILNEQIFGNRAGYIRQWQGEPLTVSKNTRLEIENRRGSVEYTASPDNRLHLSARIEGRGATEEKARAAAEAARINIENGPVVRVYTDPVTETAVSGASVTLQVAVPAGLNIGTINRSGGITVKGVSAASLSLETSSGGIEVEEYTGELRARSNNGEITLGRVSGNADIESSNGRIAIRDPRGDVKAVNRNGGIELESDSPLDGKYVLRGDNGEIIFRLPGSSSLKIKASSRNGGISGLENIKGQPGSQSAETSLGSGKGSADLETRNGHIDVTIRD